MSSKHSKKPYTKMDLAHYVQRVIGLMGLSDWTIRLQVKPMKHAQGTVHTSYAQREACITIDEPLMERGNEDRLRVVIAHELIHCHIDDLWLAPERMLKDEIGATAWAVFEEAQRVHGEYAVDNMARAWALMLPRFRAKSEW